MFNGSSRAKKEKPLPRHAGRSGFVVVSSLWLDSFGHRPNATVYFFFALRFSSIAAWAAANLATGTRNGEQLT